MEYVAVLDGISLGQLVLYTCITLFLGGAILKAFEKYRKVVNFKDTKVEAISEHTERLDSLDKKFDDLDKKFDSLMDAINEINKEANEREARRLRREILKFAEGLRAGSKPTIDSYKDIFEYNTEYLNLIKKTKLKNGFTEHEMKYIETNYVQDYGQLD